MKRQGYAYGTEVPAFKTRGEIEQMLMKHKCSQYGTAVDYENNSARVQFRAHDRFVRFTIALPPVSTRNREQLEKQRWRQLLLVIKAKLAAVESNIATFEEEFLAQIVLPNDQTVGPTLAPIIKLAYESGRLPPALALPARGETTIDHP